MIIELVASNIFVATFLLNKVRKVVKKNETRNKIEAEKTRVKVHENFITYW